MAHTGFLHFGVFMLTFSATSLLCGAARDEDKPHIVFILADDLGYNDVGYHGSEIKTPAIDGLAREGVILENYYVQPICSPTRSQLMSGRYQIHTGLQHSYIWNTQKNGLPLDSPTMADKLKEAGYSTHMIGKWHLGFYMKEYMPHYRGFDTYYGYLGGWIDYWDKTNTYDADGKAYLDFRDGDEPVKNETNHYSASLFTDKAIDLFSSRDKNKGPLFLYMAYQSVHSPLQVPDSYLKPYKYITDQNRQTYAAMVAALDEGVANLTRSLKDEGMWENTLVVFSTDNGGPVPHGGNNWPLRGTKGTLWEGGLRGAGFLSGGYLTRSMRNGVLPGTVNREMIHVSDWFPTLVEVAGGNLNGTQPLDGFSQWSTVAKGSKSPRDVILHNIDPLTDPVGSPIPDVEWDTTVRAAVRSGQYKLVTGDPGDGAWYPPPGEGSAQIIPSPDPSTKNFWLFNIEKDPEENYDISEQEPEVLRQLLSLMNEFNNTAVPCRFPTKDNPDSNPALHGGVWGPWVNSTHNLEEEFV